MYENLSDENLVRAYEHFDAILKIDGFPIEDELPAYWETLRIEGKRRLALHVERFRCDTFDKYKMTPEHREFDTFADAMRYAKDKMTRVYGNRWESDVNEKYGDAQFWWEGRWKPQDYVEMRIERLHTPLRIFEDD